MVAGLFKLEVNILNTVVIEWLVDTGKNALLVVVELGRVL